MLLERPSNWEQCRWVPSQDPGDHHEHGGVNASFMIIPLFSTVCSDAEVTSCEQIP